MGFNLEILLEIDRLWNRLEMLQLTTCTESWTNYWTGNVINEKLFLPTFPSSIEKYSRGIIGLVCIEKKEKQCYDTYILQKIYVHYNPIIIPR